MSTSPPTPQHTWVTREPTTSCQTQHCQRGRPFRSKVARVLHGADLLAVGVEGGERVQVHVPAEGRHAGVGGAQQALSQGQDGGEVPPQDLTMKAACWTLKTSGF